jgi:hypothetical protein
MGSGCTQTAQVEFYVQEAVSAVAAEMIAAHLAASGRRKAFGNDS